MAAQLQTKLKDTFFANFTRLISCLFILLVVCCISGKFEEKFVSAMMAVFPLSLLGGEVGGKLLPPLPAMPGSHLLRVTKKRL
jgi:hypothetical protein